MYPQSNSHLEHKHDLSGLIDSSKIQNSPDLLELPSIANHISCFYVKANSANDLSLGIDNFNKPSIFDSLLSFESQASSDEILAIKAIKNEVRLSRIKRDLESYFSSIYNPKIFLFYLFLCEISIFNRTNSVFFDLGQITYRYNNCTKTIILWLNELKDLGLLDFIKSKNTFFVTLKNYQQSKVFKLSQIYQRKEKERLIELLNQQQLANHQQTQESIKKSTNTSATTSTTQAHANSTQTINDEKPLLYPQKPFEATITTREKIKDNPLRFFRDMELYLRHLSRLSAKKGYVYEFEGEKYILSPNRFNDLRKWKDIVFEFQALDDCQKFISIPYHFLTNAKPPNIFHIHHQKIFKKYIREALKTLLVQKPPQECKKRKDFKTLVKGCKNEQVA